MIKTTTQGLDALNVPLLQSSTPESLHNSQKISFQLLLPTEAELNKAQRPNHAAYNGQKNLAQQRASSAQQNAEAPQQPAKQSHSDHSSQQQSRKKPQNNAASTAPNNDNNSSKAKSSTSQASKPTQKTDKSQQAQKPNNENKHETTQDNSTKTTNNDEQNKQQVQANTATQAEQHSQENALESSVTDLETALSLEALSKAEILALLPTHNEKGQALNDLQDNQNLEMLDREQLLALLKQHNTQHKDAKTTDAVLNTETEQQLLSQETLDTEQDSQLEVSTLQDLLQTTQALSNTTAQLHVTDQHKTTAVQQAANEQSKSADFVSKIQIDADTGVKLELKPDQLLPHQQQQANTGKQSETQAEQVLNTLQLAKNKSNLLNQYQDRQVQEGQFLKIQQTATQAIQVQSMSIQKQEAALLKQSQTQVQNFKLALNDPDALTDGLKQQVQLMINQKSGRATIALDPPELGPLMIKLQVDANQKTHLVFTTHSDAVRDTIEQQLPRLRELLGSQGLEMANADVSSQQQSREQSEQEQHGSQTTQTGMLIDHGQESDSQSSQTHSVSGLVDLFI